MMKHIEKSSNLSYESNFVRPSGRTSPISTVLRRSKEHINHQLRLLTYLPTPLREQMRLYTATHQDPGILNKVLGMQTFGTTGKTPVTPSLRRPETKLIDNYLGLGNAIPKALRKEIVKKIDEKLDVADRIPEGEQYESFETYRRGGPWIEKKYHMRERPQHEMAEHIQKLKSERQKKFEASNDNALDNPDSSYMPKTEQKGFSKAKWRDMHHKRCKILNEQGVLNIAPCLDKQKTPNMDFKERLQQFNRKHKCKHGFCFNIIRLKNLNDNTKRYYEVDCDHEREKNGNKIEGKCKFCGQGPLTKIERDCYCEVSRCNFCKHASYSYKEDLAECCLCKQTKYAIVPNFRKYKPSTSASTFRKQLLLGRPLTYSEMILNKKLEYMKEERKGNNKDVGKLEKITEQVYDARAEGDDNKPATLHWYDTIFDFVKSPLKILKDKFCDMFTSLKKSLMKIIFSTCVAGTLLNVLILFLDALDAIIGELQKGTTIVFAVASLIYAFMTGNFMKAFIVFSTLISVKALFSKKLDKAKEVSQKLFEAFDDSTSNVTTSVYSSMKGVVSSIGQWFKKKIMPNDKTMNYRMVYNAMSDTITRLDDQHTHVREHVESVRKIQEEMIQMRQHARQMFAGQREDLINSHKTTNEAIESVRDEMYKINDLRTEQLEKSREFRRSIEARIQLLERDSKFLQEHLEAIKREQQLLDMMDENGSDDPNLTCSYDCKDCKCAKQHWCECEYDDCEMNHGYDKHEHIDCNIKDCCHIQEMSKKGICIKGMNCENEECNLFHAEVEAEACDWLAELVKFLRVPKALMKYSMKDFQTTLMTFNACGMAIRTFDTVKDFALQFISKVFGWAYACTDTKKWYAKQIRTQGTPLYNFMTAAAMREHYRHSKQLKQFERIGDTYDTLMDEVTKDLMKYGLYGNRDIMQSLSIATTAWHAPMEQQSRTIEPFCVRVVGEPGVGKSFAATEIVGRCLDKKDGIPFKSANEVNEIIYTRSPKDDYWSGLNTEKHRVVLYDDFGQDREFKDVGELISLVSCNKFMPNLASLDNPNVGIKGSVFNPEMVLLCSNFAKDEAQTAVQMPEAIERRPVLQANMEWISNCDKGLIKDRRKHTRFWVTRSLYFPSVTKSYLTYDKFMVLASASFAEWRKHKESTEKAKSFLPEIDLDASFLGKSTFEVEAEGLEEFIISTFLAFQMAPHMLTYYMYDILATIGLISLFRDTFDKWKVLGLIIGALTTLLTTIYIIYNIITQVVAEPESGTTKTGNAVRTSSKATTPIKPEGMTEDVSTVIGKNLETVTVGTTTMKALFVKGTTFLTAKHLFFRGGKWIEDGTLMTFKLYGIITPVVVEFRLENVITFEDKDIAMYKIPAGLMQNKKDIVKHFDVNFGVTLKGQDAMVIMRRSPTEVHSIRYFTIEEEGESIKYDVSGVTTYQHNTVMGRYDSAPGDCGSPIMLNVDSRAKIVSIHIAGTGTNNKMCFSQTITKEAIENGLAMLEQPYDFINTEYEGKEHESNVATNLQKSLGITSYRSRLAYKTKLMHSDIYEVVSKHITEPAILTTTDNRNVLRVDPLIVGVQRYSKPVLVEHKLFESEFCEIAEHYRGKKGIFLNRLLTLDEAINGIPTMPYIESLDFSTSAGGKHAAMGIRKVDMFEGLAGYKTLKPEYQQEFEEFYEKIKEGIIPEDCFYTSICKDERLKFSKIYEEVKTRIISGSPLYLTLLQRMYFLPIMSHMMQNCETSNYNVGLNRVGLEWHRFVSYLTEVGQDYGFDGDFKGYDTDRAAGITLAMLKFYETYAPSMYVGVHNAVLRVLLYIEAFPIFLVNNELIQNMGSQPSGSGTTIHHNCLVNEAYHLKFFKSVVPKVFSHAYYYFKYTRNGYTGDDSICNAHKDFAEYYNYTNFKKWCDEFGIRLTPGNKDGVEIKNQSVFELAYLKNTTIKKDGMYLPKADFASTVEQLNWIRLPPGSTDTRIQTVEIANNVLRTLYTSGKEIFNLVRTKILNAKPGYQLFTYEQCESLFYHYGTFPNCSSDFIHNTGIDFTKEPSKMASARLVQAESLEGGVFEPFGTQKDTSDLFSKMLTTVKSNETNKYDALLMGYLVKAKNGRLFRADMKTSYTLMNNEIASRNKNSSNKTAMEKLIVQYRDNEVVYVINLPKAVDPTKYLELEGTVSDIILHSSSTVLKFVYNEMRDALTTNASAEGESVGLAGAAEAALSTVSGIVEDGVDFIGKGLSLAGKVIPFLDRPNEFENPPPCVLRSVQHLSSMIGTEYIEPLTNHPLYRQKPDKEHFGTDTDQTAIPTLLQKKGYMGTWNWTSAQKAGTVLGATWVGPMGSVGKEATSLTPLDYISRKHGYWRGGLVYTFDFVCSAYHEGKIDFTFHPNTKNYPASLTEAMSQYSSSFALRNGRNCISVLCPFLSETPYKMVWNGVETTDVYDAAVARFADYFAGTLVVRVSSPLKNPSNVVNNIDINVYVCAADDFMVAENTPNNRSIQPDYSLVTGADRQIRELQYIPANAEGDEEQSILLTGEDSVDHNGVDDEVKVEDKRVGVAIVDHEKSEKVVPLRAVVANIRALRHLNEDSWTIQKMLQRWTLFSTINWPMSATGVLGMFDIIQDLLSMDIVAAPFNLFKYHRNTCIDIKLQIVASRFHQGRAIATYIPTMCGHAQYGKPINNQDRMINPHVFLDPAAGTTAVLKIPFVHYKGWLDLENKDSLGFLMIEVFNSLKAAEGSANEIQIKCFFSMQDPVMMIPRAGGKAYIKAEPEGDDKSKKEDKSKTSDVKVKNEAETVNTAEVKNPTVLATERAKTSDPAELHFGDTYRTLNEYAKRYSKALTQKNVNFKMLAIPAEFTSQFWEGTLQQELAAMYALFRGPTVYKFGVIKIDSTTLFEEITEVTFSTTETLSANTEGEMEGLVPVNSEIYPVSLKKSNEFHEILIPMQTISGASYNGFWIKGVEPRNVTSKPTIYIQTNGGIYNIHAYRALGDTAAFGLLYAMPNVKFTKAAPDHWFDSTKRTMPQVQMVSDITVVKSGARYGGRY